MNNKLIIGILAFACFTLSVGFAILWFQRDPVQPQTRQHQTVGMPAQAAHSTIRLGQVAPDFRSITTKGELSLHEYLGDGWGILFSHPANFTPVCTTELGAVAQLEAEFAKRNVKPLAVSVDPLESHKAWIKDINRTQNTEVNYPLIADPDRKIAELYGMIHPDSLNKMTVRTVFIIDPNKKVRLTLTYPPGTGRNFDEILRVIDSMQLSDTYGVATPANWKDGEACIISPKITDPQIIADKFPKGYTELTPYLRMTPQPNR